MTFLESPNAKLRVQLQLVRSHLVRFMKATRSVAAQSSLTGVFSPGPVCEMSAHLPDQTAKPSAGSFFIKYANKV